MTKKEAHAIRKWRRLVGEAEKALQEVPAHYLDGIPEMALLYARLTELSSLARRYDAMQEILVQEICEIIGARITSYDGLISFGWQLRAWIEGTALKKGQKS